VLTTEGEAIALSGQPYVLKFASFDPGADTIQQWIVDWGDGSPIQTASGNSHELSHTFQQPGTRARIQVGAIDEDGAWSAATRTVDVVNDRLLAEGKRPIAFDHDCREGICGMCGVMINGEAHGPVRGTTTWDTDPGAIGTRKLELRIAPDPSASGHVTGLLRVELSRDRTQDDELRFVPPPPST
jgi:ferredoxin